MTSTPASVPLWMSSGSAALPAEPLACIADGPIAHMVINRPAKRNAMTAELWRLIRETVERLAADSAVRLVVVRGAGEAAFSGGADIEEFPRVFADAPSIRAYNELVRTAQIALERLEKPTLAVIRGACVGGGCGVALSCDIRFAADTVRMGITPAKLGTVYSVPDTRRLVALVGISRAKDILFSGRLVDAAEALSLGMVNYVVPPAELDARAAAYARLLLANSRESISTTKAIVNAVAGIAPADEAVLDARFEASFASKDFRKGFAAFIAKRPPKYE